jgi:hypothetical protein
LIELAKPQGLFFVAQDPVHVVVRSEIAALHDTAGRQVAPKQRRLFAKFERGIPFKWALDAALELFNAPSRPNVPESRWFAFLDTLDWQRQQGLTDEETVVVEEALLTRPGIFQVFPAKLPAPYPGYDKFKGGAKALAEKLVEDGYDLDAAVAYERENKNRPSFVAAFEEAQAQPVVEEAEAEVVA